MPPEPAEFAAMDRLEFARFVKRSHPDELRELMRGSGRDGVLRRIFGEMHEVLRADRAGTTQAVIHWRIGDRLDGDFDIYEVAIDSGRCEASAGPRHPPQLTLTIGGADFIRVVTGNANPTALFLRGKMKAAGDIGLAMRFAKMFDLPKV